jgi:hypothetical protein
MLLYAYVTPIWFTYAACHLYENGTHELLKYMDINQAIEYP